MLKKDQENNRLRTQYKILRTSRQGSNFTGSYKKNVFTNRKKPSGKVEAQSVYNDKKCCDASVFSVFSLLPHRLSRLQFNNFWDI